MKQAFPLVFRLYDKASGQSWYLLENDCSSLLEKSCHRHVQKAPKILRSDWHSVVRKRAIALMSEAKQASPIDISKKLFDVNIRIYRFFNISTVNLVLCIDMRKRLQI
ncbi:hypothetical protein B6A27_06040 [Anoxybacillus sp. UARK-01]|nr:hypothetical protein B6A27_06040 [Anoxybacillus sp. UARK-01]